MQLYDQHTHSIHSNEKEAISTVEEMCLGALEQGLAGLAVTDHCDMYRDLQNAEERMRKSVADICAAKERFAGKVYLAMGVELGSGHLKPEESQRFLSMGEFDIVLGSLHAAEGVLTRYSQIAQDAPDKPGMFRDYLDRQLQMAQWGGYDVLGHLTFPCRYFAMGGERLDIRDYEEQLRALFTLMAQKGRGLEVNTSGLYNPTHGVTMPELWELKLFRECGGEIVTVGSDSHSRARVGCGIRQGMELLKEAGFRYMAVFRQRKPEMIAL